MTDAGFYAQIAAAPEAVEAYLVLADALQQRGDPRGDLIVTQRGLETATERDAADLRKREGEALIANLATWLPIGVELRKQLTVRWRWGFVHRARSKTPESLAALLGAPQVDSTLVELHLSGDAVVQQLVALCEAWPAALRRLELADETFGMHGRPIDLSRLPPHALESLGVRGQRINFGRTPAPSLRRLDLRAMTLGLPDQDWPNVEELVLWSPQIDLSMLARFPKLRRLCLGGTRDTDALAKQLVLLRGLEVLQLDGGTLTSVGARTLKPLAKHVRIDVRRNLIKTADLKRLETAKLVVRPQRTGDQPLSDRATMSALVEQLRSLANKATRAKPEARRAKIAATAALCEPGDAFVERGSFVLGIEDRATKRDALRELLSEAEHTLMYEIPSYGVRLQSALAFACDSLDELYAAEVASWQALRDARWYGEVGHEAHASGQIATLRMRRGDSATAAPMLERVEASYRTGKPNVQQAWALRQRGNAELTRSNFVAAEQLYRDALAIYEAVDDKPSQGIVLSELSSAYWYRSDFAGAEQMLRRALELKHDDSAGTGSTYYNLATILNGANRIEESIAAATTALEIFTRHCHTGGQGQALSILGELWQRKNEHARALELLERAATIFREAGRDRELGITLGNIGRVALDRGDWARAREVCDQAVEIHRQVGNKYNEGLQLTGIADAAIGEREWDEADAWLLEALVPLKAINNHQGIASVHHRRGIVAQLSGKRAVAERHYKHAMLDATRGNWPEMHGWVEMWIALAAAQANEAKPARAALKRATAAIPESSIQGIETLAMTNAVVARLLGEAVELPQPASWDSRIIACLASA